MHVLLELHSSSSRWLHGPDSHYEEPEVPVPEGGLPRLRKFHPCTRRKRSVPEQTPPLAGGHELRGTGGGLRVGRTSFDSVHWLKSGSWARPTAYWTAPEQPGPWANHMAAREIVDTGRRPVLGSAGLTLASRPWPRRSLRI